MYFLRHVGKAYSGVEVFRDLNCQIPTDKFVFIVGPSGSGKSTLLRLLCFVDEPTLGDVELVLGQTTYSTENGQRPWPRITCVFQRQFLWPHLTIRQNITLPLVKRDEVDQSVRLQAVVNLFGMSGYLDRYPNEVSGGEAQRAALARAFVLKPELILIDEVHGGLDIEQQMAVNRHLVMLRNTGVGLIVVTHSWAFAEQYADLVLVVENHTVTALPARDGHVDESRSPFLARLAKLRTGP